MNDIVFKRVAPDESRIYLDGDHVGDVYAHDDILHPGRRVFVIHLGEDPRGPVRVRDRARIREVVRQRLHSHPLWA